MVRMIEGTVEDGERVVCSFCESSQLVIIGKNMAECTICGACRAV